MADSDVEYLIDPAGQLGTVPKSAVQNALKQGYTPASPQQINDATLAKLHHEKYGGLGGELKAAATGAARGLTFGLSDVALTGLGVEGETLRGLKEENPIASGAGELAGIAAPALLSGGTGLAARAAKMTGPGLAREAGNAARAEVLVPGGTAERLAGALGEKGGFTFDPLANRMVEKGFAVAPSKATEGIMRGEATAADVSRYAREHVDDLMRGDKLGAWRANVGPNAGSDVLDISRVMENREAALAAARRGEQDAIFDLGAGETIPTASAKGALNVSEPAHRLALNEIARKALAEGAGSATETATYALGNLVSEAAIGDPNLTAESALAQVGTASLLGLGGGLIGSGVWNLARNAFVGADLRKKITEWFGEKEVQLALKATNAAPGKIGKEAAKADVNKMVAYWKDKGLMTPLSKLETVNQRAAEMAQSTGDTISRAFQQADAMMQPGEAPSIQSVVMKAKARILGPLRDDPFKESAANALQKNLDDYAAKYSDGMGLTDLWEMRRQVDGAIKWSSLPMNAPPPAYKDSLIRLRTFLNKEIDSGMEKIKGLPGDAVESLHDAMDGYHFSSTLRDLTASGLQRRSGGSMLSLSDKIIGGFGAMHNPMAAALGVAGHQLANRVGPGVASFGAGLARDALSGGGGSLLPEAVSAGARGVARAESERATAGASGDLVRTAGRDGALRDVVNKTAEGIATDRRMLAEQAPAIAGQAPETDMVQRATALGDAPEQAAALSELQRMVTQIKNKIDTQAGNIVRGTVQGHGEPASFVPKHMDENAYSKRSQELMALTARPENMQGVLLRQTDDWAEHAPQTALATNIATVRAAKYLASIVQPVRKQGPLAPEIRPNQAQIDKFARSWDAVSDPMSVMKAATSGTLTAEAVQAVKTVYPALYAEMQNSIMDKITSHRGPIAYRQRRMASMLLGQDLDGTMNPGFVLRTQQAYQAPQARAESARGGGRAPASSAGKITLGKRSMTETQRRSSGEER